MRRVSIIAAALLSVCAAATAADVSRDGGTADWMCCTDKACTQIVSQKADPLRTFVECAAAAEQDGQARWIRSNAFKVTPSKPATPPPPPPTCSAPPASTTRTQQCPAGTVGTWSQTSSSSVGAPPDCVVTTTWSPSSPPAGACVVPPPPNTPPTISGTPIAAVEAGKAYSFLPTGADADAGDTLSFSIANKPTWATFSTATGLLSGTPAVADVGISSSIVITVSDGKASASTPSFTITVTAPPLPDLAAPVVTSSVTPNAANPANSDVRLSWNAIAGATAYKVQRCTGVNCNANFTQLASPTVTSYSNTNLPPGFTFGYRVQGIEGSSRQGLWSAVIYVTTPTNPPPPTQTGSILLKWTPPTQNSDGSALTNLAGYDIYWSSIASPSPTLVQAAGNVAEKTITGLAPGNYTLYMFARNSAGALSVQSATVVKTVQ